MKTVFATIWLRTERGMSMTGNGESYFQPPGFGERKRSWVVTRKGGTVVGNISVQIEKPGMCFYVFHMYSMHLSLI